MSLSNLVKREIFITIISVAVLIAFFSLFTYAYYMDIKETDLSVIKYGDLTLEFCADATCDSTVENIGRIIGKDENGEPVLMYPQSELEALENIPYIFKVTNNSSYKQTVTIKLSKQVNPALNEKYSDYKDLDTTYLYSSFGEVGLASNTVLYNNTNEVLGVHTLEAGEAKTFNLWLWIKSDAPNSVQGSYFIADISLTGEYFVDSTKWYEKCENNTSLACKVVLNSTAKADDTIDFSYNSAGCKSWDSVNDVCIDSDLNQVTQGLYYTADSTVTIYGEDNERIYYYRGDVDNNWVSFAGYLWRIVRTTSEGEVKLIYSGDGTSESSGFIATSAFNETNNNKYYLGYTYNEDLNGYENTQSNSTLKNVIDAWYSGGTTTNTECSGNACDFTGLPVKLSGSNYSSYLSDLAVYCNDRSYENILLNNIEYPSSDRLKVKKRPTFVCSSVNKSRYSVNNESGNGYLTNSIGILSADEIVYAGLNLNEAGLTTSSYIMDNASSQGWWTMSPNMYSSSIATGWSVNPNGSLSNSNIDTQLGIRPSITLKSCVTTIESGDGTFSAPYELSNAKCN